MAELLKSSVGIIMPTCDPAITFMKLIPSLKNISELSDVATFLINFNGSSWTNTSIANAKTAIERHGFEVMSMYSGIQDKPLNIIKLREDCAALKPYCDIYLFIDDDFRFVRGTKTMPYSSGERYRQSIDYMTRFPTCGVINTKSFMGGYTAGLKIMPSADDIYATNRGLFLRNMKDYGFLLSPKETHHLVGDMEEIMTVMARIELGFFCAKQFNNPTVHITGHLSKYQQLENDFHNMKIIDQNVGKYIREKYSDPYWDYQARKFPHELWQLYHENGGSVIKKNDQKYTVDYSEYEKIKR